MAGKRGCPRCGFTHGWDGSKCSHCRFEGSAEELEEFPEEEPERPDKPRPPTPREAYHKEFRGALLVGLGLLVFNFAYLLLRGQYYPVAFIGGPPTLLLGVYGLLFPPKRETPDGKLELRGGWLVIFFVVGLVIGCILAYDPIAVLRAVGVTV